MRHPLNRFWAVCLVLVLFAFSSWAQQQQKTEFVGGQEVAARQVLVKFRAPAMVSTLIQVQLAEDVDAAGEIGGTGVVLFRSRSKDAATLVRELAARPDVEFAEPNFIIHAIAIPNDPRFSELWGLRNTGQVILGFTGTPGADISAVPAWDISTGSRANVVTVVDTGIDYTHPDLAANVWSAPRAFSVTVGGRVINCAAGTHGYNAITKTCNPMDDHYHGTHVSGTVGAVGNNALGVVGVNWTASIMGSKFLDASGTGTTADAIDAIEFAIQAKLVLGTGANVRALSNSWGGGGFSQALLDEINKANANDMLFVAAAGNDYLTNNDVVPHYPSSYNPPNMVAVAATDNTDALAYFSNYGPTSVHLGAPGQDVLSTLPGATYDYLSGTSMATPHVSGAAALILSKCALNTAALKTNILNNVDPNSSLAGRTVTGGRLNVNKAIRACSGTPTPDFALSASPASQTAIQGAGTSYTVTLTPSGGFTGTVTFSASGLPAGAGATFSPSSVTTSGTSTMSVTTSSTTPTGSYPLTITGVSGSLTRTTSVTLVVAPPPDFSLSATPSSQSVVQGASTSYTVNITRTGGFTGGVTFNISGLPAGAAGSFSPNPSTGASSALSVTTASTTPTGSFALTITGVSGSLTHTASATLVVTSSADFSLSATPSSQSVVQGASTSYTVNITRTGGFTGGVTFSISGLPAGAAGSFSPNPSTGASSALSVTPSPTTPTGSFALTITGVNGSLTHATSATLVITPLAAPDFSLSATPSSQSVVQGAGTSYTVNITRTGGFTGGVTFSISGLPAGAAGSFSPNPSTGASSTLSVTTSSTTPTGSYPLTITGVNGSLTHAASATLVVTPLAAPDFSLSATPSSQTVVQGASTSYTVNITRTGGFAGAVTFSASGLPAGATASFSPNGTTGNSSTMTVSTLTSTPTGSYALTITGVSGSLTRTTPVTLVVVVGQCDGECP